MEGLDQAGFRSLLLKAGFSVESLFGAQASPEVVMDGLKNEHKQIAKQLMQYHPEALVASFLAPMYQKFDLQCFFICNK